MLSGIESNPHSFLSLYMILPVRSSQCINVLCDGGSVLARLVGIVPLSFTGVQVLCSKSANTGG